MTEPPRDPETAVLRRSYRTLQTPGSETCPSGETLAALALGELTGDEREKAADHVVSCRRCSEDTQLLMQTHAEAGAARSTRTGRQRRWLAVAAAAVFAVVAGRLLMQKGARPHDDSAERGSASGIAQQVAPSDGAVLSGAPERFAWPPQKDADGYRVKLFDSSGEALWQSERVSKPEVGLPPLQRARLEAGQAYFWNVEVEGRLEKTRLGPFRLRLSSR